MYINMVIERLVNDIYFVYLDDVLIYSNDLANY